MISRLFALCYFTLAVTLARPTFAIEGKECDDAHDALMGPYLKIGEL